MKCFDTDHKWKSKVNYVDENNVVLGYDMSGSCCEVFGHGVFASVPANAGDESTPITVDLEPYRFVDEKPTDCLSLRDNGGGLAFRISAPGLPDLYVVIWNFHNGYYSHGFTFKDMRGSL